MNVKLKIAITFFLGSFSIITAQYSFSGVIEDEQWNGAAYLSVVDDYRKTAGIHEEQIINKITIADTFFKFTGDNLNAANKIYRIHVDNCSDDEQEANHFYGHCDNSREILFIANNRDTINFPVSLDNQMFCSINATNTHSNVFFKIDSLKELMLYDFSTYRSSANRKLNNKKWFERLQQFGVSLDEPLAELYIYNFLSDRSSDLYAYYKEDLKTNAYYDDLQDRLAKRYPNSTYLTQYKTEIASDKFASLEQETTTFSWKQVVYILLGFSLLVNALLWFRLKKSKKEKPKNITNSLTQQEQKILALILKDKTNKEIATEIFVSVSTVKTHINNLYKKLNVASRDEVKRLFNR